MVRIGKVEAVLAAVNGTIVGDLRNRLQYLQTIDFPPGLRVGSARRADYGLEEVFAIALVFALARAGVTPATAAAVVADFWPEIARAMIGAGRRNASAEGVPDQHDYLLITAGRLPGVVRGSSDPRAPAASFAIRAGPLDQLDLPASIGSGACALIDVDLLFRGIVAALTATPDAIDPRAIEAALDEVARRQVARGPDLDLSNPLASMPKEAPPSGLRLSAADYYFARAREIAWEAELFGEGGATGKDRRTAVLLDYVREPAPRERWKARLSVGGVELLHAVAVLTNIAYGDCLGVPRRKLAAASARLQEVGLSGVTTLAQEIRRVAETGGTPVAAEEPSNLSTEPLLGA